MKRAMFLPSYQGGGFGHVGRCTVLANELSRRGWQTGMLLDGSHVEVVKQSGCKVFVPWFPKMPKPGKNSTAAYICIQDGNIQILRDGYVRAWRFWAAVTETIRIVRKFRPDILVGDFSLLTWIVGKRTGLPVVQIAQSISHPLDPRIIWWEKPPSGMVSPSIERVFNPVLEKWKIQPVHRVEELLQGDLFLIPSIPELEPLPQNVTHTHYIGALLPSQSTSTLLPQLPPESRNKRLVYVTLGGGAGPVGNSQLFVIINEALGNGPWSVIVSTGRKFDPSKLQKAPSNIAYYQWVNGPAMINHSNVVVFHGGHGTMMETVNYGVPSVVLPFHSEQEGNGRRLETYSASIVLSPASVKESMKLIRGRWTYGEYATWVQPVNTLNAEKLREAVSCVLEDPRYKEGATALKSKAEGYGGAAEGAELIIKCL
jgi:UDP:flavonoid glycosyltransferase YjiC (YdhE family)